MSRRAKSKPKSKKTPTLPMVSVEASGALGEVIVPGVEKTRPSDEIRFQEYTVSAFLREIEDSERIWQRCISTITTYSAYFGATYFIFSKLIDDFWLLLWYPPALFFDVTFTVGALLVIVSLVYVARAIFMTKYPNPASTNDYLLWIKTEMKKDSPTADIYGAFWMNLTDELAGKHPDAEKSNRTRRSYLGKALKFFYVGVIVSLISVPMYMFVYFFAK